MEPRVAVRAALLLLLLLPPALGPAPGSPLCGRRLLRALVRACGAPRWAEGDREWAAGPAGELLRWLDARPHLHRLAADGDPAPAPVALPPPGASSRRRRRREWEAAITPARRCCLSGCSQQDLLALCPS
ncbi:insulin-like 3 [Ctenodactylus gundi]